MRASRGETQKRLGAPRQRLISSEAHQGEGDQANENFCGLEFFSPYGGRCFRPQNCGGGTHEGRKGKAVAWGGGGEINQFLNISIRRV